VHFKENFQNLEVRDFYQIRANNTVDFETNLGGGRRIRWGTNPLRDLRSGAVGVRDREGPIFEERERAGSVR
jgi:hypothetical protein